VFDHMEDALQKPLVLPDAVSQHIAWPNLEFTRPNATWIRPTVLFGERRRASLGGGAYDRLDGILVVDVFTPIGVPEDRAIRDAVIARYPNDAHFEYLPGRFATVLTVGPLPGRTYRYNQNSPAGQLQGGGEADYYQVPVHIRFQAFPPRDN